MSSFASGYEAGVVHALAAMQGYMDEKGVEVPYGVRDAVLSLIDGD